MNSRLLHHGGRRAGQQRQHGGHPYAQRLIHSHFTTAVTVQCLLPSFPCFASAVCANEKVKIAHRIRHGGLRTIGRHYGSVSNQERLGTKH